MISGEEAWRRLVPHLAALPQTRLPRPEASGRVLARSVAARCDTPFADVSAMDGYALAGELGPGARLPVVATVAAGDPPGLELRPGAAARIMTGAPVPRGADRVVPVEETDGGEEEVLLYRSGAPGDHVRRQGEVVRRGDLLLAAGAVLSPEGLGLLAGQGYQELEVVAAPRVALLVTGDEVVPPDREPAAGQLRDSHTDFLLAALAGLGLPAISLGIAPDRPSELREAVAQGLGADVLLVTGGVSRGAFDFVEEVLAGAGCSTLFDAVAIQPGKPLVAAVRQPSAGTGARGALVFGLPGNPASVAACFWLFVRPALRRLLGHDDGFWRGALRARLTAPLPAAMGRDRFLPARLRHGSGLAEVEPLIPRGSHDLVTWARGTALARVPRGQASRDAGEECEVLPTTPPTATG